MQILRVEGGFRLNGEAYVDSAKNAVLPLLAAAVMSEQPVTLLDTPDIMDVENMLGILRRIGCVVTREGSTLTVDAANIQEDALPQHLAKLLRSSIFMLGPMLGRMRHVTVTYPGGCEIGLRPIDLHLRGLKALGVKIIEEGGLIHCDGANMRGGEVHFDYPSVGATENVMMAAALAPGQTTIHNAAREPEIEDLQRFMNACGARVRGAGTDTITIQGVRKLRGTVYRPIPDRIVAGTLLVAAAMTGGEIALRNAPVGDMVAQLSKLRDMGCDIHEETGRITLAAPKTLRSFVQLQTQPHPGFPTDMQAQMLAAATVSEGVSLVMENVFENRFGHVSDLCTMGADIMVNNRMAVVRGVKRLYGGRVCARDLRGGAALVLAGLVAEGVTEVENIGLIDRGYAGLETMLSALGAHIARIEEG